MLKKNIYLSVLVLLSHWILAQNSNSIKIQAADILNPSADSTQLDFPDQTLNYKVKEAYLKVKLSLGEIHKLGVKDVDYTVPVQVTVSFNGSGQKNEVVQLQLEEDKPVQLAKIPLMGDVKNITNVKIAANLITSDTTYSCKNPSCELIQYKQYIENNIQIDAFWDLDLGVDVKASPTSIKLGVFVNNIVQPLGERVLNFSWSNGSYHFTNYHIQILRLYNINPS